MQKGCPHYYGVIMGTIASQITSLTIVYSTVYSDVDQRKHQSSASLAFVWRIHRGPVNSPHKWPVTQKIFPFDDVIMMSKCHHELCRLHVSHYTHGMLQHKHQHCMACFTKEFNPNLPKWPMIFIGSLAKCGLISLAKLSSGVLDARQSITVSLEIDP